MSTAYERQVIAQVLATYVAGNPDPVTNAAYPVEWPNKTFDPPVEGATWIRFSVLDVTGKQLEMGSPPSNTNRTYGSLILQLFAPADQGDGAVLALGDILGALYRQQVLNFPDDPVSGHVRMRNPVVKQVGRSNAYWQVNVIVPFQRDDIT